MQSHDPSVVAEHFFGKHAVSYRDIRYAIVSRVYKFGAAENNTNPPHRRVGLANRRLPIQLQPCLSVHLENQGGWDKRAKSARCENVLDSKPMKRIYINIYKL